MPAKPAPDPHADHAALTAPAGETAEPAPPRDFAAERVFGAEAMAAARHHLHAEHGAHVFSKVMVNELEWARESGRDGYAWDAEAWLGGDIQRAVLKTEGEGEHRVESAEVQALYSRAIGPYFDVQVGLRHDFRPSPSRSYAVLGVEGLAPYWFEVEAAAFLSDQGDLLGRIEASYEQLITQRLVLQPAAELNFAAQDMAAQGLGRGLSDLEVGLRLRYELRREFAPYIGVSYGRKIGRTADLARAAGEKSGGTKFVAGIRAWF
jgi:copper resistance protein B